MVLESWLAKDDSSKISFYRFLNFFCGVFSRLEKLSSKAKDDFFIISSTILFNQFLIYRRVWRNS